MHLSILSFFILLLIPSAVTSADDASLVKLWRDAAKGNYQTPTLDELHQAERLFYRQLGGEEAEVLTQPWRQLGFALSEVMVRGERFIIVKETVQQRHGRGFYVFAPQRVSRVALQAPHSFKDLWTGDIALKLMAEGDFLAGAWNTLARDKADVAHLTHSYFNAFTRAFTAAIDDGRLVQLHGFSQKKRRTREAMSADIILSDTEGGMPSAHVRQIAACLETLSPGAVRLYPEDVKELGGTRNLNARAMRAGGGKDFAHVEMSKPLRQRLRRYVDLRQRFGRCIYNEFNS